MEPTSSGRPGRDRSTRAEKSVADVIAPKTRSAIDAIQAPDRARRSDARSPRGTLNWTAQWRASVRDAARLFARTLTCLDTTHIFLLSITSTIHPQSPTRRPPSRRCAAPRSRARTPTPARAARTPARVRVPGHRARTSRVAPNDPRFDRRFHRASRALSIPGASGAAWRSRADARPRPGTLFATMATSAVAARAPPRPRARPRVRARAPPRAEPARPPRAPSPPRRRARGPARRIRPPRLSPRASARVIRATAAETAGVLARREGTARGGRRRPSLPRPRRARRQAILAYDAAEDDSSPSSRSSSVAAPEDDDDSERAGVRLLNLAAPRARRRGEAVPVRGRFADPDTSRRSASPPRSGSSSAARDAPSASRAPKSTRRGEASRAPGDRRLRRITDAASRRARAPPQCDRRPLSVYVGMRYWKPFTEDACDRIKADRITKLVVLPLYPQFSISTSGSSCVCSRRSSATTSTCSAR